jgi:hypothetical protein
MGDIKKNIQKTNWGIISRPSSGKNNGITFSFPSFRRAGSGSGLPRNSIPTKTARRIEQNQYNHLSLRTCLKLPSSKAPGKVGKIQNLNQN